MLRTLLTLLFAALFFLLTSPLLLLLWLTHRAWPRRSWLIAAACLRFLARGIIAIIGVRLVIQGLENVPQDRPVVYMGNHRSIFDVICAFPNLTNPTSFVSKKELEHTPFLSAWMACIQVLFLDRKNPREGMKMFLSAVDLIKGGSSIFIFPEGTRDKEASLLPFHEGSFKIATKSGAPIIPVAISNSSQVFEDQHMRYPFSRPATVILSYGAPIETKDLDRVQQKALVTQVHDCMVEMLLDNGRLWRQVASQKELLTLERRGASLSNPGALPSDLSDQKQLIEES